MTDEQIAALKNAPFPIVESLTVGAAALRAAAEVARGAIKVKLESDLSAMRREYARQQAIANAIIDGRQEPYDYDQSNNQML